MRTSPGPLVSSPTARAFAAFLPLILLTSCASVAPRVSQTPQADLEHTARTEQEFIAFNPNYKAEKAERIAKARASYAKVRELEAAGTNTACSKQILWELKALVTQTADFKLIDQ